MSNVCWHSAGPTAVPGEVRIDLEDERREQAIANAEHPVEYAEPELPSDPMDVTEGEGWKAVARANCVITNLVHRRSEAEYHGFEVLSPVELPIRDSEEYDFVEVDADPDDDRQPNVP